MKTTAAAIVMTIAGLTAVPAQAGTRAHFDDLACQLERQAVSVRDELRRFYNRTPQYAQLYSDVNEIARRAGHIHQVAHTGNLRHLRHDVNELDRLFHHVEGVVELMSRHHRTVYRTSFRGKSASRHWNWNQAYYNPYRRLVRLVNNMENTLHHMQADLNTLPPIYRVPRYNRPSGFPILGGRAYLQPSRRSSLGFSVNIR